LVWGRHEGINVLRHWMRKLLERRTIPISPQFGDGEATGDNLRPRSVLMTNFGKTKKSDYPIWETGVSDFCSFRIKSSNDLNMKI
jgi:hypothetical protein